MNAITESGAVSAILKEVTETPDVSSLISAIGGASFGSEMMQFLGHYLALERLDLFEYRAYELVEISSVGATAVGEAGANLYQVRSMLSRLGRGDTRVELCPVSTKPEARQSVLMSAKTSEGAFCIRLTLRPTADPLSDRNMAALRRLSNFLVSIFAKHAELTLRRPDLTPALRSLENIEACLVSVTELSRREAEVCARILYGLSSCGIAVDLGIGKESVMTYRKRAYSRLGIGSQRELLMWYLSLWSNATAALETA